jgi:hypothetical protein
MPLAVAENVGCGGLLAHAESVALKLTATARAPPEDCKKFRRFSFFIEANYKPRDNPNFFLVVLDLKVFPSRLHTPTSVNLQTDYPVDNACARWRFRNKMCG